MRQSTGHQADSLAFFIFHFSFFIFLIAGWLGFTAPLNAQISPYNHPELKWQTIETDHFAVHFHDGAERTAREVAGIAEDVYAPITALYDYEPDGKIHFIIRDHDDYSNGASYYYDQKIEIWASPLDFELRGQHHWLFDVVTHEFTHMIQLGASRKGPRWMPGMYFQVIDYEPEKRPDVLYGFPNRIASWPVAGTSIPMWFAEGTAQFMASGAKNDYWDSHRDMMLRARALEGNLLTQSEMDVFGKSSINSEYVYNQGYALVRYIADQWGDGKLMELSAAMRRADNWSFSRACRQVLGISERELYNRWKQAVTEEYQARTATIKDNEVSGEVIRDEGFGNLYPVFSPDGKKLAFVSNKGQDYLSLGRVVIYDIEQDTVLKSKCPAGHRMDWSPDGKYLLYSRQDGPNKWGSNYDDLFLWDIEAEREIRLTRYVSLGRIVIGIVEGEREYRLTRDARLSYPSFAPDGKSIIAVHTKDGTHNLALLTLPDSIQSKDLTGEVTVTQLTNFDDGRQIYTPKFSPDGTWILCSTALTQGRDLYRFDLSNNAWEPFIATEFDERDAVFSPDGEYIYWSDDRTGIFNIYRQELSRRLSVPLDNPITNVLGGAFMPAISPDGRLAYAEFTAKGYGIRQLTPIDALDADVMTYLQPTERERLILGLPSRSTSAASAYKTPFLQLSFLPRLTWDYGKLKPGFYAYTSDVLERFNLFGGAAMTLDGERDLYLNLDYRVTYPTLFLEIYNILRKNTERFDDPFVIIGERQVNDSTAVPIYAKYAVDYRFNLTEYNVGARVPLPGDITASAIVRAPAYKAMLNFDDGGQFEYSYFKGTALILRGETDKRALHVGRDIHPKGGWLGWMELSRENNNFLDSFRVDLERGFLEEVYTPYNYFRVETDIDYYKSVWGDWVLNPRLMGGWLSEPVDPFFHLYAGGLLGLRGYSFYSLGGRSKAVGRLSLRFPIAGHIDAEWGPWYLDRIHGALFAEAGDAWVGDPDLGNLKRDVGAELRVKLFSWYGFPTDIQFTGAYGLDRLKIQDEFNPGIYHEYGREWRWYLTVLFDFL